MNKILSKHKQGYMFRHLDLWEQDFKRSLNIRESNPLLWYRLYCPNWTSLTFSQMLSDFGHGNCMRHLKTSLTFLRENGCYQPVEEISFEQSAPPLLLPVSSPKLPEERTSTRRDGLYKVYRMVERLLSNIFLCSMILSTA